MRMRTSAHAGTPSPANTDKWTTRQLITMSLLCSIGILLSFIEFPIFPAAPFLKYDASFVPAIICALAYGSGAGLAVGIVDILIHTLILADPFGGLINLLVITAFILPTAGVYKAFHTYAGAIVGLVLGVVAALGVAILGNLLITPLYTGTTVEVVLDMIVPILLPFNAIKHTLNAVLTLIIYKTISNLITPKKLQVKGK